VEPVLGWVKEVLGFRRFSMRGVVKARGEWNVVCLAGRFSIVHSETPVARSAHHGGHGDMERNLLSSVSSVVTSFYTDMKTDCR
jgi:hypothetical protein